MMDNRLPLGILRHCIKALDIAIVDLHEASADEDLDEATSARLQSFAEMVGNVGAGIINLISDEISEEDFIREEIPDLEDLQDSDEPDNIMEQEIEN